LLLAGGGRAQLEGEALLLQLALPDEIALARERRLGLGEPGLQAFGLGRALRGTPDRRRGALGGRAARDVELRRRGARGALGVGPGLLERALRPGRLRTLGRGGFERRREAR